MKNLTLQEKLMQMRGLAKNITTPLPWELSFGDKVEDPDDGTISYETSADIGCFDQDFEDFMGLSNGTAAYIVAACNFMPTLAEEFETLLRLAVMVKRYMIAMNSPIQQDRHRLMVVGCDEYGRKINQILEKYLGEELTEENEYKFIEPITVDRSRLEEILRQHHGNNAEEDFREEDIKHTCVEDPQFQIRDEDGNDRFICLKHARELANSEGITINNPKFIPLWPADRKEQICNF